MSASANQHQALFTTIASITSSTLLPTALHFHILAPRALAEARKAARCMQESGLSRGANIQVHAVDTAQFSLLRERSSGAASNLLRFYLPRLLPDVQKVIWVDADGIMRGDVRTLASSLFVGANAQKALAAVERPAKSLSQATGLGASALAALGLSNVDGQTAGVFNAGFLGFNLRAWRERHITEALEGLVAALDRRGFRGFPGISTKDAGTTRRVHDSQTPILLYFRNASTAQAVQPLDPSWNVEGLGWKTADRAKVCAGRYLHRSGKNKPWDATGSSNASYTEIWRAHAREVRICVP
jgi:hypothetical protein|tara:strand:+ start:2478 stop:3374 length:897 start_codon:yes stop_codon:yes gene_type:complete